jgi:hypothetical protein
MGNPISIEQPAKNLQAQLTINVGIGSPPPSPRVIVVESQTRPQNVILVEKSRSSESEYYRGDSDWGRYRGRYEGFSKHGRGHKKGHSKDKHDRYEDDNYQYRR